MITSATNSLANRFASRNVHFIAMQLVLVSLRLCVHFMRRNISYAQSMFQLALACDISTPQFLKLLVSLGHPRLFHAMIVTISM